MASIKDMTEPIKVYPEAKEFYHENALNYFDKLVKDSNTDLKANKEKCDEYYKKLDDINSSNKILKKLKRKKGWLIFLAILCGITIVLLPFTFLIRSNIKNKIKPEIDKLNSDIDAQKKEAEDIKAEAYSLAINLLNSYDYNDAGKIFTETIPLVELDRVFDNKKFTLLNEKYGLEERTGEDNSTLDIQSGSILGNPFILEKVRVREMLNKTYTGTLVITWTTTYRDSNGHTQTQTHTQTLVATLVRPAPFYHSETWLTYGCEAAPNLYFSRDPSGASNLSEKQIKKMTIKSAKNLDKKARKDGKFTRMENDEFEALYGGTNRDNEVEFRLLFTPLAQSNMIQLIKMKEPFGDDFSFTKMKKLNYSCTTHSQSFNYNIDPNNFVTFDLEKSKEAFINYCDSYMVNMYFELAPILCIPLYGSYKATEFIYKDNHKGNYSSFEAEAIANKYDYNDLKPNGATTDLILRSKFIDKNKDLDSYSIFAYAYKGVPRVELVPTMGGDGRIHPVPVHWVEYFKVVKETSIGLMDSKLNRKEYINSKDEFKSFGVNGCKKYYKNGLVSAIIK